MMIISIAPGYDAETRDTVIIGHVIGTLNDFVSISGLKSHCKFLRIAFVKYSPVDSNGFSLTYLLWIHIVI